MKEPTLDAFFSDDPTTVAGALAALSGQGSERARSHGAVTSIDTLYPVAGEDGLRPERRGIFSQVIFGPVLDDRCACGATQGAASRGVTCPRCSVLCDRASLRDERWGHVDVVQVVHPSVYMALADATGVYVEHLRDVVAGKRALRPAKPRRKGKRSDGGIDAAEPEIRWDVVPEDDIEEGDLVGPSGLAEALRRVDPEHSLLPLCTITKVPIPPAGARPFAPPEAPTQVDPWIGPLNEAWVTLVERANRERRLVELGAPPVILRNESAMVQKAFDSVFRGTQRSTLRLVPPLARVPDALGEAEALAMAFAGPERLIVQRRDRVTIVDLQGRPIAALPPAGTLLRGVVGGRYGVFEGFFGATHPMLAGADSGFGPDFVEVGEEGVLRVERALGEISMIDCETGTYLDRPPPGRSLRFVTNDQPEDIFLTTEDGEPIRHLRAGGDRPGVIAYAPGMGLAWVGEEGDSTEIIELERGIPHARPCEPDGEDVPCLELLPGDGDGDGDGDEDIEDEDQVSATAAAFRDGAWYLLWSSGILCDHRVRHPVRLLPSPEAAAFDPAGRTLALLVRGTIVLVDVARREVTGRFSLQPEAT